MISESKNNSLFYILARNISKVLEHRHLSSACLVNSRRSKILPRGVSYKSWCKVVSVLIGKPVHDLFIVTLSLKGIKVILKILPLHKV